MYGDKYKSNLKYYANMKPFQLSIGRGDEGKNCIHTEEEKYLLVHMYVCAERGGIHADILLRIEI
jgi:hypothetical protein